MTMGPGEFSLRRNPTARRYAWSFVLIRRRIHPIVLLPIQQKLLRRLGKPSLRGQKGTGKHR